MSISSISSISSIRENVLNVYNRIEKAAKRSRPGGDPSLIELVAVTKTVPIQAALQAIEAGIKIIGENRVQEAKDKYAQIESKVNWVKWHMVGHLQTNKVKLALEIFDMIHSVDSVHLLEEIEKRATQLQEAQDILIQVNTSGEPSKYGVEPDSLVSLVKAASKCQMVKVKGLMTIGTFCEDPELARPCFTRLKRLSDEISQIQLPNVEMKYLSMGMTNDFEVAIEEGANIVRIGTAIFGARG